MVVNSRNKIISIQHHGSYKPKTYVFSKHQVVADVSGVDASTLEQWSTEREWLNARDKSAAVFLASDDAERDAINAVLSGESITGVVEATGGADATFQADTIKEQVATRRDDVVDAMTTKRAALKTKFGDIDKATDLDGLKTAFKEYINARDS